MILIPSTFAVCVTHREMEIRAEIPAEIERSEKEIEEKNCAFWKSVFIGQVGGEDNV